MTRTSAVWIDVEDLFLYGRHNARMSGIQRLTCELYDAIEHRAAADGPRVGYVRIDPETDTFRIVPGSEVHAIFRSLTLAHPEPETPAVSPERRPNRADVGRPAAEQPERLSRRAALAVHGALPEAARNSFLRFCLLQSAAIRTLSDIARPRAPNPQPHLPEPTNQHTAEQSIITTCEPTGVPLHDVARPGDWLLSLGASWHRRDYGGLLERVRHENGLRTGLLIYDLIPLRRPEWCHHTLVEAFGDWLDGVLPSVDALFAISNDTARDLTSLLAERGHPPGRAIRTIPMGTGFPASTEMARVAAETGLEGGGEHGLPPAGSYVLFVSTMEARKNHLLMFQVWRRLAQLMPPKDLPTLVFAGRVGWLVADLMLQIENTNYCDGKLSIIEDPSDAVLTRLYAGCLFTVLPSLSEGWGLPVTESLAAGKPCITSGAGALLEAGMGLTRTLDPLNLSDAVRVIQQTLADRDDLARWEAEVRRRFVPVPWTRAADVLLDALHDAPADVPVRVAAVSHV